MVLNSYMLLTSTQIPEAEPSTIEHGARSIGRYGCRRSEVCETPYAITIMPIPLVGDTVTSTFADIPSLNVNGYPITFVVFVVWCI
jgi:hypothetical protein